MSDKERYEIQLEKTIKELTEIIKNQQERIDKAFDFIGTKTYKFTMAYMEEDNRINLGRSEYTIGNLTSKNVKELLEILKGEDK